MSFTYVDFIIFLFIIFFIWQGLRTGFLGGLLNLFSTIVSFITATYFYPRIGGFLVSRFNWSQNIALVFAFAATLITVEILLNLILGFLYSEVRPVLKRYPTLVKIDKYLGIVPSVFVGLFLVSLLMLLTLILPVRSWLRDPIQNSWWGKNVASVGFNYIPTIENFLTQVPYKNLVYILTPASSSDEGSQTLNLPKNLTLTEDPTDEKIMFDLVNQERSKRGLNILRKSKALTVVGRAHCLDMFKRSYFSHYTPEGKSPFDRMDAAGIDYTTAGENLAYAPSVTIAHQGLMNSPGHRGNILRDSFGTLGVGVIDAGLNGKMFCQEFTN